ncbi:MAG TPA: GMC oxidoreductase [Ruminiclostridium sp.]|nr:GMC oxidoreductase [Ruminiclostridium sp.]
MYTYIAQKGDTLSGIAKRLRLNFEQLMFINQHITNSEVCIEGQKVNIQIPVCYPQTPLTDQKDWIPLTPLREMSAKEYDVLIVGTGAGGSAVLWRLCERLRKNGMRIGIIERGDLLIPTNYINIPTLNATSGRDYYWNVGYRLGNYQPEFPGATEIFALGGRTLFWSANTPRLNPCDMIDWPISYKEIIPYYNIAEEVMNISNTYTKDSKIASTTLEILRKSGFPDAMQIPVAADLSQTKFGQVHSNAFFSSILFLARALYLHTFDLAVNARAIRIFTKNGKAAGVEVMSPDKEAYFIKAKNIVLSAGTWETPRLLLYSGIKGSSVGHYLSNHSKVVARVSVDRNAFGEVLGTLDLLVPRTGNRPYQVTLYGPNLERYLWYQPYEDRPLLKEIGIGIEALGIVEPRYENHISLNYNKLDEYGVPEIQVKFSYGKKDMEIIGEMFIGTNNIVSGIGKYADIKSSDICLYAPGDDYHEVGTCRMGDDPSTSVINRYGQLHGIPNLYVADNSVYPINGAANPTLTTVSLAIRTADYICHQLLRA